MTVSTKIGLRQQALKSVDVRLTFIETQGISEAVYRSEV